MKPFTTILFLLIYHWSMAQVATVKDPDGWANVRSDSSLAAPVIHKVKVGTLFWYDFEFDAEKSDWVKVYLPIDQYCPKASQSASISGYLHKSRLQALDSLKPFEHPSFKVEYHISSFDATQHQLEQEEGFLLTINGKSIWGTDGALPYNQLDSISISIKGQPISIANNLTEDLYNLGPPSSIVVYRINEQYIVYSQNSDGSGFYELAWLIEDHRLLQRLVGSSI